MAASGEGVTVYTLGHSRHAIEAFIDLARLHDITLVVDVRGQPFSRFNPQYNRERFKDALAERGIDYLWFGDRLSGRPTEPEFHGPDGKVLWDKLRRWPALHEALAERDAMILREILRLRHRARDCPGEAHAVALALDRADQLLAPRPEPDDC